DYLAVLARLAELQELEGDLEAAVASLRTLLEHDPADEAAHRDLMRLYALLDRRLPALRQFERLRTVLGRELGVEPSDESEQLYRQILEGRMEPAARTMAVMAAQPPSTPESSRRPSRRAVGRR